MRVKVNGKMDNVKITKKVTDSKNCLLFSVYKKRDFYGYIDYYPVDAIVIDLTLIKYGRVYFTTSRRVEAEYKNR